jgi:hypothetical protein
MDHFRAACPIELGNAGKDGARLVVSGGAELVRDETVVRQEDEVGERASSVDP